jgi:hypothetical protein
VAESQTFNVNYKLQNLLCPHTPVCGREVLFLQLWVYVFRISNLKVVSHIFTYIMNDMPRDGPTKYVPYNLITSPTTHLKLSTTAYFFWQLSWSMLSTFIMWTLQHSFSIINELNTATNVQRNMDLTEPWNIINMYAWHLHCHTKASDMLQCYKLHNNFMLTFKHIFNIHVMKDGGETNQINTVCLWIN